MEVAFIHPAFFECSSDESPKVQWMCITRGRPSDLLDLSQRIFFTRRIMGEQITTATIRKMNNRTLIYNIYYYIQRINYYACMIIFFCDFGFDFFSSDGWEDCACLLFIFVFCIRLIKVLGWRWFYFILFFGFGIQGLCYHMHCSNDCCPHGVGGLDSA